VDLGGGRHALLAGDALYTVLHLAVEDVLQMQTGAREIFVDTVRRIQWLHRLLPGLVILSAPDSTPYGTGLVRALLDGDGVLTDDAYAEAKAYERETFDSAYRLNPARRPRYVPGEHGAAVGSAFGTMPS
jgi:hypothetical protein